MPPPTLSLSVVSHGQGTLVRRLLRDLSALQGQDFEVILTVNIPEPDGDHWPTSVPLKVIHNQQRQGFGANHNAAFRHAAGAYFAVVNPDISTPALDLSRMIEPFADPRVGACAPLVLSSDGTVEDSVRRFPTLWRLLERVIDRTLNRPHRIDYRSDGGPVTVEWAAGMFIVFRREAFEQVKGFDQHRYFMYFEDVDICMRMRKQGWLVKFQPATSVIHNAQRASHHSLAHLRWHVTSALRYLSGI